MLTVQVAANALTVANDEASGPGSFHQAIVEAAAQPSGTTAEIVFDSAFFGEPRTIVLTEALPALKRSIIITGPPPTASGEPMVTLSGDRNRSGTLDNDDVPGLHLEVPAEGSATLRHLAFSGFRSTANPGGAVNFRPEGPAQLTIEDCVFTGNQGRWGGAVTMGGDGHQAVVRDCVFTGNVATLTDGGALHLGSTPALVERCLFRQNTGPHGGAIHTFHGEATIRECLFDSNASGPGGRGGAITARNGVRIFASTFMNNRARAGGALFLSQMLPPSPGAVIENVTFSSNQATAAPGGALYAIGALVLLRHCTLTLNHANLDAANDPFAGGGGIAVPGAANPNQIRLHNCLIAGNRIGGPGPTASLDLHGPVVSFESLGGNIIGVGGPLAPVFTQPGDQIGSEAEPLDARLDPLELNGGPHPTHLPQPDSPAIDTGVPGPDPVVATDQRGLPRPSGSAPDAGAVEWIAPDDPG